MKDIDKARRQFLWAHDEELSGGKCKVNWKMVCSPIQKGGLGIQNLQLFGSALRLRWLWLEWMQPDRPWKASPIPCDSNDRALFTQVTKIAIGDGKTAKFWTCHWLGDEPLCQTFPMLFKRSRSKLKTVVEALQNESWIRNLGNGRYE